MMLRIDLCVSLIYVTVGNVCFFFKSFRAFLGLLMFKDIFFLSLMFCLGSQVYVNSFKYIDFYY